MRSYRELLAQRAQLDADIAAARALERRAAIAQIRSAMTEYGITVAALGRSYGRRRTRVPLAPKYRNPATGAIWSGQGRPPGWIAGQDREQYRIGASIDASGFNEQR
ncbi:DNA-binding protein Bv3F [Paraburkholderia nemoris]|uniref:H-NS histone family protein n=1 Tax=Paraburkholderia nemoris TaxID=2793076 RepID=UPI00190BEFED|nr:MULTISPECIES: H-NS histone family protein [Paraburkholderia]MBK3786687.1 H-NS histone family protein [Paraburkholderia aspalathi]CAE6844666.1 DNA-binding protein Bv3F [Paraburkholderia nemoris]